MARAAFGTNASPDAQLYGFGLQEPVMDD